MRSSAFWLLFLFIAIGCVPKEQVVLRSIENVALEPGAGTDPILKADAHFYNPNQIRVKVKGIQLEVFIDGKKSATINQKLKLAIHPKSDFKIPIEVQLSLKEIGLVDALLSLFGGKKYELRYVGHIKVTVKGFPVKIPVDYNRQVKLRM